MARVVCWRVHVTSRGRRRVLAGVLVVKVCVNSRDGLPVHGGHCACVRAMQPPSDMVLLVLTLMEACLTVL